MRPQPRMQNEKAYECRHHGHAGNARHSPHDGFNGFLRDLLGDRAWLSPSPAVCLRKLDASVEAPGPHDFAVRLGAVRQRHLHVHRTPPRVRDDRDTPLLGTERGGYEVIWVEGKGNHFLKWGWTPQITLIWFGKLR